MASPRCHSSNMNKPQSACKGSLVLARARCVFHHQRDRHFTVNVNGVSPCWLANRWQTLFPVPHRFVLDRAKPTWHKVRPGDVLCRSNANTRQRFDLLCPRSRAKPSYGLLFACFIRCSPSLLDLRHCTVGARSIARTEILTCCHATHLREPNNFTACV